MENESLQVAMSTNTSTVAPEMFRNLSQICEDSPPSAIEFTGIWMEGKGVSSVGVVHNAHVDATSAGGRCEQVREVVSTIRNHGRAEALLGAIGIMPHSRAFPAYALCRACVLPSKCHGNTPDVKNKRNAI